MKKLIFHFQVFVPAEIQRAVESLRGNALDFGPHARKRWTEKFGSMPRPSKLPLDAQFLEIVVKSDLAIDTVLFRFAADEFTDVVLSMVAANGFVCSTWRAPKWFGLNTGRPTNPRKYVSREQYLNLKRGGSHAA